MSPNQIDVNEHGKQDSSDQEEDPGQKTIIEKIKSFTFLDFVKFGIIYSVPTAYGFFSVYELTQGNIRSGFISLIASGVLTILAYNVWNMMLENTYTEEYIDHLSKNQWDEKIRGNDLINLRNKYPTVKNYTLCQIQDVYTTEYNKEVIKLTVNFPDSSTFKFDYPYYWDEDGKFETLVESLGYDKSTFTDMKGEYVFVKEEDSINLILNDPVNVVNNKIEENEWQARDGNFDEIETKLDTEFKNIATGEDIIINDTGISSLDDIDS